MPAPSEDAAGPQSRVLVISPCRNEEETLRSTVESMRRQLHQPVQWVVVDDGSTDSTAEILTEAEREIPWLKVAHRSDRGFRKLGGGVIDTFYAGLEAATEDYDFVCKMDVDLNFGERYIERALEYFAVNPKLASISGKVFRTEDGALIEEHLIDEMVAGQFKFYRREAFEQIGGFVREVMWDGIDFHRARMAGWLTRSVPDPELQITHLRLMGSTDRSVYRGRLRWGYGQWFMGTAFPYILASGVFRMREKPLLIGGMLIVGGYLGSAIRLKPRYDDLEFRRGLRSWQYARLGELITGRKALPPIATPQTGSIESKP